MHFYHQHGDDCLLQTFKPEMCQQKITRSDLYQIQYHLCTCINPRTKEMELVSNQKCKGRSKWQCSVR